MSVVACGQSAIFPDTCMSCGGYLHRVVRHGFPGRHGWRFCSEDCVADDQETRVRDHATGHRATRDLLCDCAEVCAPLGLPTQAMKDEYADYLKSIEGTDLDPRRGIAT